MPRKRIASTAPADVAADPVVRGRALATAGKREAHDGYAINEALQAELREHRLNYPKPWLEPIGIEHARVLAAMAKPKSFRRDLSETAFAAMRSGRRIAAGLAFIELRHCFARESDWLAFIDEQYPCGNHVLDYIEALIAPLAFRKAVATCAKCQAEITCQCACGAPYLPAKPWIEEPEPQAETAETAEKGALERASEAITSDPGKSNRLIAKELGVTEKTVRRARANAAVDAAVDGRTGADGRTRHLPRQKANGKARASNRGRKPAASNDGSLANTFIRDLLEFTFGFKAGIDGSTMAKLSVEDREQLVATIYQSANDLMLVAQELNRSKLRREVTGNGETPLQCT